MEEKQTAYRFLVKMPKEKRSLGIPRCRQEDNIQTDREIGWACRWD
jgi:hypothetical protein